MTKSSPTSPGDVPALADDEAWNVPAATSDVKDAVQLVTALVEPEIQPKRLQALATFLASENYSAAEIRYAGRELPKDEHLDAKMRYGKPLTPADFDRVIKDVRRLRARLRSDMSHEDMIRMIEMEPRLSRDDFGQRHDQKNRTRYLLKAEARRRIESDTPTD